MELLKQRILQDGQVRQGGILKVDSFLNHRMDIPLLRAIGQEFANRFAGEQVDTILTIEASGIGVAAITSLYFQEVPVVFAKKTQSKNLDGALYTAPVHSYTKGVDYTIQVAQQYLKKGDRVLILDDFLANGQALQGLLSIVEQAGAVAVGCGIVIEKGFQPGGAMLRERGVHLESLAILSSIADGQITFA